MPELPEVEVIRRGLLPHLTGRQVEHIICANRKFRLPMPRAALNQWIKGETIKTIDRRAKYLLIRMTNGAVMMVHLGMTGRLGLFPFQAKQAKHDHLRLRLDNGLELRFNDTRRFGSIQVQMPESAKKCDFFAGLGPEPLEEDDFTPQYLLKKSRNRKQPVKNFLMDNRVVVGIGNIYAAEILFAAGIAPITPVSSLTQKKWEEVVSATRDVLQKAISAGGTTIADFVNHRGNTGYFQLELQVYGREGQACYKCGATIRKIVLAGRSTCFCNHCQT